MPIEPLEGAKYVSDLNQAWPLGSDEPSGADDHLRGIKNCVKNTFPNLDAPVTKTADELNAVSLPSGATLLFYQRSPPTGWSKVSVPADYMVRMRSTVGGTYGGVNSPIRMDKVPVHTHSVLGATKANTHSHGGATQQEGAHNHQYTVSPPVSFERAAGTVGFNGIGTQTLGPTYPSDPATHAHQITANTHTHEVGIEAHANVGASAGEWSPRFANVIVCQKD